VRYKWSSIETLWSSRLLSPSSPIEILLPSLYLPRNPAKNHRLR